MRSTIRLPGSKPDSLSPPQGIFALQKSLRGDCGGDGVPAAVGNSSPRAKKFPEEICFAPSRVSQVCRTPDQQLLKSTKQLPAGHMSVPGSPGVPEGPRSLCFGKSPEEPLPRGFFGQLLRGGSTPRFFAQLRSVGSKKDQLAGLCQNLPWSWTTGPVPKRTLWKSFSRSKKFDFSPTGS